MNPVSYAGDRDLVFGHARPNIFPQPATDFAVELADPIGMSAQSQRQNCHAKWIGVVDAGLTEGEKFVERQSDFGGKTAEVFAHHVAWERIVTRRHRSMSGEDICRSGHLKGGIEIELFLRHEPPNPLQPEEGGVSLVHMKDFRLNPEDVERVDPANSEHDFLAHSHFKVAAVELGGDEPIFAVVFGDVGVEKVKLHPPDVEFPKSRVNVAVENADTDQQGTIVFADFADRQVMKILI